MYAFLATYQYCHIFDTPLPLSAYVLNGSPLIILLGGRHMCVFPVVEGVDFHHPPRVVLGHVFEVLDEGQRVPDARQLVERGLVPRRLRDVRQPLWMT